MVINYAQLTTKYFINWNIIEFKYIHEKAVGSDSLWMDSLKPSRNRYLSYCPGHQKDEKSQNYFTMLAKCKQECHKNNLQLRFIYYKNINEIIRNHITWFKRIIHQDQEGLL